MNFNDYTENGKSPFERNRKHIEPFNFFFLLNTVGPFKASAENFANAFSNMSTS